MGGESWTVRIGRVGTAELRLHAVTCIFAIASCYFVWSQQTHLSGDLAVPSAIAGGMLILALVVHQSGHYFAARRLGETLTSMVLFPFGARNTFSRQPNPGGAIWIHLAGPVANATAALGFVAIGLACGMDLGEFARHPLLPSGLIEGAHWQVALKTGLWLQGMLVMINSLPCGPFDAAMAVKALAACRDPEKAQENEQKWLRWGACLTACLLTVVAMTRFSTEVYEPVAFWLPLTLTALLLFFSAGMERTAVSPVSALLQPETSQVSYSNRAEIDVDLPGRHSEIVRDEFVDEFAEYETSDSAVSMSSKETDEPEFGPNQGDATSESDLVHLDRILAKLHREGRAQLTPDEINFLEQASERFRQRMGQ